MAWDLIFFIILLLIALAIVSVVYRTILSWRQLHSAPPMIKLETDGVKLGLTVVEAAALSELPLDRVLKLALFGAFQKGAVEVISAAPLKILLLESLIASLHHYEITFLKAFAADEADTSQYLLSVGTASLIEVVSEKMTGFKRPQTITHYRPIIQEAWQEMEKADLPALKNIAFSAIPDWANLVKQYEKGLRDTFGKSEAASPASEILEAIAFEAFDEDVKFGKDATEPNLPDHKEGKA